MYTIENSKLLYQTRRKNPLGYKGLVLRTRCSPVQCDPGTNLETEKYKLITEGMGSLQKTGALIEFLLK